MAKFNRYFDLSPDRLGLKDVGAFQVHLVSQGISWLNPQPDSLPIALFPWRNANRAEIPKRIAYAGTRRKLPTILSADEVVHFLEAVPSLKARAALTTAYAAGLRASKAVSLQISDFDSDCMVLQVRYRKGAKDRTVMPSPQILGILWTYWRLPRPTSKLFPGRGDKYHDQEYHGRPSWESCLSFHTLWVVFDPKVCRVARIEHARRPGEVLEMTGLEGLGRRRPSEF